MGTEEGAGNLPPHQILNKKKSKLRKGGNIPNINTKDLSHFKQNYSPSYQ
jgi:hypothetical protein